jgi:cold-inducible RNA-binding protein
VPSDAAPITLLDHFDIYLSVRTCSAGALAGAIRVYCNSARLQLRRDRTSRVLRPVLPGQWVPDAKPGMPVEKTATHQPAQWLVWREDFVKNIFVGNLAFSTTEDELRTMFESYGRVDRVSLLTDRDTGRSRGFAFVEMADEGEAEKAIAALNGSNVGGRTLNVNEARPKPARAGGPGGGRGDRGDRGGRGDRSGAGRRW